MALSKADLEALSGLIDNKIAAAVASPQSEPDAVTAKVLADAPQPRTQRASGTASKAATLKRNLDPIQVEADESHAFVVLPHSGSGTLFTRGARVVPHVDGKRYQSLDIGIVRALQGEGVLDGIAAAIEEVNKRAKLADHKPQTAEATV